MLRNSVLEPVQAKSRKSSCLHCRHSNTKRPWWGGNLFWFCCCCSWRWGDIISLNLGRQRAYCLSKVWYISKESHSGMILTGKDRKTWKNLTQCHHKSHTDWSEREPGPRAKSPAENHPSHGTAYFDLKYNKKKRYHFEFGQDKISEFLKSDLEQCNHWLSLLQE
jgi:hypothetical protein